MVTGAVKPDEAVASARVELQAGVCQQLLAVEGERQAADVDIRAVGVGSENASHGPSFRLPQLELVQLLG